MIEPADLWTEALRQQAAVAGVDTEAARRLAVTALYYATFHVAGRALGFSTADAGEIHNKFFLLLCERNARAAGRFNSLRKLRVKAHYFLREHVSSQDLQVARHHADAVLTLLGLTRAPD